MRQRIILLILPLLFLLSGCTLVKEGEDSFKFKYLQLTTTTNFEWITANLLDPMCEDIKKKTKGVLPIYVVDFVNLDTLQNHSELGFILSDNIKSQVTQGCNTPIYSLEYAKYLKMGEKGSRLLSRDLDEMVAKKMNKNTYALVGTYAITQRQLITHLKLIDLKSGLILKSATDRANLTDEILRLESETKVRKGQQHIRRPLTL